MLRVDQSFNRLFTNKCYPIKAIETKENMAIPQRSESHYQTQ